MTPCLVYLFLSLIDLFRMGRGGDKSPPISYYPVTSPKLRISPQNFLAFNFNPFVTLT